MKNNEVEFVKYNTCPSEKGSRAMQTYESRVKMPNGSEQKIVVKANSRQNAEAMAAAMTGGKVLGGRQLPS